MSTRGMAAVLINGVLKTSLIGSDAHPGSVGSDISLFVKDMVLNESVVEYRVKAEQLVLFESTDVPSEESIKRYGSYSSGLHPVPSWGHLLYELQGDMKTQLDLRVGASGGKFYNNSIACEYGYVINFDNETLEVYRGFQDKPHQLGRFASPLPSGPTAKWYPIALLSTFAFTEIAEAKHGTLFETRYDEPGEENYNPEALQPITIGVE